MTDAESPVPKEGPKSTGPSRLRIIGARVLTVLAILLALVGMVAFYVEHTALDEDGFETISRNMIENDAIRMQVANTAVDTLFTNVDVEAGISPSVYLLHSRKSLRFWPASRALVPIGLLMPRSNVRVCRPCGWR